MSILGKPRKDFEIIATGELNAVDFFDIIGLEGDRDKTYLLQLDQEASIRFVLNDDCCFSNYRWPMQAKSQLTGDHFYFQVLSGRERIIQGGGKVQYWLNHPDEVHTITAFIEKGEVVSWQLSRIKDHI